MYSHAEIMNKAWNIFAEKWSGKHPSPWDLFAIFSEAYGQNLDWLIYPWYYEFSSADLAILLAIVSSYRDRILPRDMVIFGEVGLSGEIRPVPSGQERLSEAAKHGFKRAIVPRGNAPKHEIKGMQVIAVAKLSEALDALD